MKAAAMSALLVILLGIISSTQTHLAKALERQGIETLDVIRAKLRDNGERIEGQTRKPFIYTLGLVLNHTTWIYHLLVAPLDGTIALYTSMYGIGLVALLLYSAKVMREPITRTELGGALTIIVGTLIIGVEGVFRPPLDMGTMDLADSVLAVTVLLGLSAALILVGLRNGLPDVIGLAFGLSAGMCGSLDPFLKGLGQTAGGGGVFTPGSTGGWVVLVSSFVIGWGAFLITQWGFYRRARANILVPAYNCSYIGIPVLLQVLLLPGYVLYGTTILGLALIMAGFLLIRGFGRGERDSGSRQPSGDM